MKQLPARVTAAQRAMLDAAGPISAATRAVLWIGLGATGVPLPPEARREVFSLLVEELAPEVLEQLQRLADRLRADGVPSTSAPVSAAPAAPAPAAVVLPSVPALPSGAPAQEDDDDPYGSLGIEFDG